MSSPAKAQERKVAPARGAARERLLAEAATLFQARGFADVSMQEIADASGVTKAAMYYHFQSKEDLFAEVARQLVNEFWEGIIGRASSDQPLLVALRSITHYLGGMMTNFPVMLIEDVRRHLPPEAHERIFRDHPTPATALRALFQRAIASGEIRPLDSDLVAGLFLGMAMSLGQSEHAGRPFQPGDEEVLLDVLLHGIANG